MREHTVKDLTHAKILCLEIYGTGQIIAAFEILKKIVRFTFLKKGTPVFEPETSQFAVAFGARDFVTRTIVRVGRYLSHCNCKGIEVKVGITFPDGDRFNSCQVIYSQFGMAIQQNDHQERRRFVEWAQNEIAVVPDFHKLNLFSDEAHFWLNGYVNKQNYRIWSEANPQVYVETPLHPEKMTVWWALWAGGILLQKR
ncbi:putative DD41D transposase [Trichonephila clavipes]|nr:putative DD41D transposase [Trichonephila clavipes]